MRNFLQILLFCLVVFEISLQSENVHKDISTSSKEGSVNLEIAGDTSDLFDSEDFEKKEAVLLGENSEISHEKNEQDESPKNATQRHNSHPECTRSNFSELKETNSVQLVNGSRLTTYLSESNSTDCFFVLFFVTWCPFSARLAPIFNALPRAFPNLDVLAFDVSKSVGYNTKFGTSAVPMLLMFQHKNVLAKFNYTSKNLTDYIEFVANITGYTPNKSIEIEVFDTIGPVSTVVSKRFDFYLFFSWCFLIFVSFDYILRKTQFKQVFIKLIMDLFNYNRLLQLPQPPYRPMIQNRHEQRAVHPHFD